VDVSSTVVDPTRPTLIVESVESPRASPVVIVSVSDLYVNLTVSKGVPSN
jgi:hypothetical protein